MATFFKSQRNYLTVITHVSLWAVFIGAPILFDPGGHKAMPKVFQELPTPEVGRIIGGTVNIALIVLFYLNYGAFLPRLYLKGKIGKYFLAILASYCAFQSIGFLLRRYFFSHILPVPLQETITQLSIIFSTVFFVLIWASSSGFRFGEEWRRAENKRRETEQRRLEAELALFKSQINPHFLLNTLNNLYALSITTPTKTPEALLMLSDIVRYILYECSNASVPLASDLSFIQNYLSLQRLRLPPNAVLTVEMPDPQTVQGDIEPMILISFIENMFKHGLTTQYPCELFVSIKTHGETLQLYLENPVLPPKTIENTPVSGIGLANARQRLQQTYPNKHTLNLENDGVRYRVTLQIELKNDLHRP